MRPEWEASSLAKQALNNWTMGTVAGVGQRLTRGNLGTQAASPRPEGPDAMKVRPLLCWASEGPLGCPAESTPHSVLAHSRTCMLARIYC